MHNKFYLCTINKIITIDILFNGTIYMKSDLNILKYFYKVLTSAY